MVAFRNADSSGRPTGLLLRCVLYSLVALGLIIVDKRYDHLGKIRQWLSVVAYPVQAAVASPFQGYQWFRESVTTRETLRTDKARLESERGPDVTRTTVRADYPRQHGPSRLNCQICRNVLPHGP